MRIFMIIKKKQTFDSSDLGCCAALITANFELLDIDNTNSKKVVFVFDNSIEINKASEEYWSDNLQVSARRYFENIKMLKSRIYEGRR